MLKQSIFASTLGLSKPWEIASVEISADTPRLDLYVNCIQSITVPCPVCGEEAKICDISEESWVHSDFFNKVAFLHARVPVLTCESKCCCYKLNAPWAQSGSRFILQEELLPPKCSRCDKAATIKRITS